MHAHKKSRFRSLPLVALLLATVIPPPAFAEDAKIFFDTTCRLLANAGDRAGLEKALDAANKELRGDYRYLYYRAIALYSRGEYTSGQLMGNAALAAMKVDQFPAEAINQVKQRLASLHNSQHTTRNPQQKNPSGGQSIIWNNQVGTDTTIQPQ
jgi:hypothetical protein